MRRGSLPLFFVSLIASVILQLIALPDRIAPFRPEWVALTIIYWALMSPERPVLVAAFVIGIGLDVLFTSLLGEHALALLIVAFLIRRLRGTIILFPLWQISLSLVPAWALYTFFLFWMDGLSHHSAMPELRWMPVVSTSLLWPLAAAAMDWLSFTPKGRRLA